MRRTGPLAGALSGALIAGLLASGTAMAQEAPPAAATAPGTFTLQGAGFGHGVGMSQWGAYGMAKAGYDATGIVTHYFQGTQVAPVQDDADIRVALNYQVPQAAMRTEPLEAGGGAIEVTIGPTVVLGGPVDEFVFTVSGSDVGVERHAGGQVVDLGVAPTVTVRWAGTRNPGQAVGAATLLNVARSRSSLATPGHRYRYGIVDVVPVSTKSGMRLNIVNSVRVHDEYLLGISEVSSSWPDAALQAQVLAARSYALSKLASGVRQACSCHVDDGGGPYFDQTFTGWSKASAPGGDRWLAAVGATHASDVTGLAILHDGKPIRAFYHASSGGATQSVKDVWGGTLPYVIGVPDPWMRVPENPDASWQMVVPQARMAAAFGAPAVVSVDVAERNPSGAVKSVRATLPDGTVVTRTGPQWATALGLKSRYVMTVDGREGVPIPAAATPAPPAVPPAPPADPSATPAPADPPAPPEPTADQPTVSLLSPLAVDVRRGGTVKVVGVVRPATKGLMTWRQKLVGTEWKTLDRDRTSAKGRYRFVVRDAGAKAPGTYRVLVVRKKAVMGVSPEFVVTLGK